MTGPRVRDYDALTGREEEVLALVAEGLSNLGIARRLFVTEGAIERHITSIFWKLDLGPHVPQPDVNRRVMAVLKYQGSLREVVA